MEPSLRTDAELAKRIASTEAVLFDLDGTLVDTVALILSSMRHATHEVLGQALPDEVLMHNVGVPLAVQMSEFSEEHVDDLLRVYRAHNAVVHDQLIAEYPGVEEALVELVGRYRLGVVTSKSRALAMRALERFQLDRFFEVVVACEDVERHKPDPYPVLYAAGLLGIPAERCAYVGDSPHDVSAALGAGALAVGALWGVSDRERVMRPGPDCVVADMSEVVQLFVGDRA